MASPKSQIKPGFAFAIWSRISSLHVNRSKAFSSTCPLPLRSSASLALLRCLAMRGPSMPPATPRVEHAWPWDVKTEAFRFVCAPVRCFSLHPLRCSQNSNKQEPHSHCMFPRNSVHCYSSSTEAVLLPFPEDFAQLRSTQNTHLLFLLFLAAAAGRLLPASGQLWGPRLPRV